MIRASKVIDDDIANTIRLISAHYSRPRSQCLTPHMVAQGRAPGSRICSQRLFLCAQGGVVVVIVVCITHLHDVVAPHCAVNRLHRVHL